MVKLPPQCVRRGRPACGLMAPLEEYTRLGLDDAGRRTAYAVLFATSIAPANWRKSATVRIRAGRWAESCSGPRLRPWPPGGEHRRAPGGRGKNKRRNGACGMALPKQLVQKFVSGETMMCGDACQNGSEGAEFQGVVVGEGDVVFAMSRAGQANVAAGLASSAITQAGKAFDRSAP